MTKSRTPASANLQKLAKQRIEREAIRISKIAAAKFARGRDQSDAFRRHTLGILFDWSKQRIDSRALLALEHLGQTWELDKFLMSVANGDIVNSTENRSAQHMALREPLTANSSQAALHFASIRREFLNFADSVRDGTIRGFSGDVFTDFVHIGIGGSHLGPALVCEALTGDYRMRAHFCSNADRRALHELLQKVSPNRTIFIVASKSYSTHETLENARSVRSWMYERIKPSTDIAQHFVHITSKVSLDVGNERVFLIPETVGGRFSLWSAMGLPVALAIGSANFLDLLKGAYEMDCHVLDSELPQNVAARTALLALWNANYFGATTHLVLPYDSRLRLLPAYCQQLEMESNGKSVGIDNEPALQSTSPVVWGGLETDGQHAWHQFLHQGTQNYSADIIATLDSLPSALDQKTHQWILANAIGQGSVMLKGSGTSTTELYKSIEGNHGSTLFLLEKLDARTLGVLLAMYEHKVAYLGHLWGVNSFDQWGVEEGKRIAGLLSAALQGTNDREIDDSTAELVRTIRERLRTR